MKNKKFMTGVFCDLHFIAELQPCEEKYKCIPKYSGGNGTDVTFFATKSGAKFYDTLPEAIGNKRNNDMRNEAIEEDRILTGCYNPEY